MNLPAHIITCSPPSMNLPAHGTTSPDPSFTSQHDNENKQSTLPYTRYILKLVLGIPMLPRTSPLVVQHTWSTSYIPPRTQHLTSVSTKHTNLSRSYPHTRVIGYEPPRSYHHVFITNHEPTRSSQHQAYPRPRPTQQTMQNISQCTLPLHHHLA